MVKDHSDSERGNPLPSFWLAARVLLYAPSHRQDNTYHRLCYTNRGALPGMRNSSMDPQWRIDLTTHERMLLPQSYVSHQCLIMPVLDLLNLKITAYQYNVSYNRLMLSYYLHFYTGVKYGVVKTLTLLKRYTYITWGVYYHERMLLPQSHVSLQCLIMPLFLIY